MPPNGPPGKAHTHSTGEGRDASVEGRQALADGRWARDIPAVISSPAGVAADGVQEGVVPSTRGLLSAPAVKLDRGVPGFETGAVIGRHVWTGESTKRLIKFNRVL